MSLLVRTALSLLIGALLIASIGAVGLRYFVHRQIREELDDQLRHEWQRMAATLARQPETFIPQTDISGYWRATPVSGTLTLNEVYADTIEYDQVRHDHERIPVRLFRQGRPLRWPDSGTCSRSGNPTRSSRRLPGA